MPPVTASLKKSVVLKLIPEPELFACQLDAFCRSLVTSAPVSKLLNEASAVDASLAPVSVVTPLTLTLNPPSPANSPLCVVTER